MYAKRVAIGALLWLGCQTGSGAGQTPRARSERAPTEETVEVKLCDDRTTTTVPKDMPPTRENGQRVADSLMSQWKREHPNQAWEMKVTQSHPTIPPPADNRKVLEGAQRTDQTYALFTERDVLTWERETLKLVQEGARVFHDAEAMEGTIGVSCDMCHPDAANTHPETYPKFQTQLGRVVLLRDMINWCLEHPVKAPRMEPDDPRMRALEAYIIAQRKGVTLEYGKH